MFIDMQLGKDVLEPLVEGFVVVVSCDQVVSYVIKGGLKLETVVAKFVDLIHDKMNVGFVLVNFDGLFLLALLDFDFFIRGLVCLLLPEF